MPAKEFKIATMNLYNLQLPNKEMYRGRKMKKEVYEGKILWTAEILKKVNADVIGFQELWHPDALEEAFKTAGLLDSYDLATMLDKEGVTVALAAKKPLEIVHSKWEKQVPNELILKKDKKRQALEPDYKIDVNIENFSRFFS
ncbi:MAG: endonuclease/exonuclease/phosphatase family protein, partial [Bacteroidota bacterium]